MTLFGRQRRMQQEEWRRASLENHEPGSQNGRHYFHILPRRDWELGLYPPLRAGGSDPLATYLQQERVKPHTGIHNLCSSWVLCANMYFPFRDAFGRSVLASFLREHMVADLRSCDRVHLEYEHADVDLKPNVVLGEDAGGRGTGQTSPDVAFEITSDRGNGLVLVESKFTEHWLYECSGHKRATKGRPPNPDRSRCGRFSEMIASPATRCHLDQQWGRRYWEYLLPVLDQTIADGLSYCPAAKGGYQLLRQQALAEALAARGRFSVVVSAVAYDGENQDLFRLRGRHDTPIDLRELWPKLFHGRATFATFTHQDWVAHVRLAARKRYPDWLAFVEGRYGFH